VKHYRLKLIALYLGGFLVSIAPLVIVVALNFGKYTATKSGSFSLALGGVVACIFFLLKAVGKLPQKVKSVFRYGFLFGIVCLLEPLILDLKYLSGACFLGELFYVLIFPPLVANLKERHSKEEIKKTVGDAIKNSTTENTAEGRT